MARRPRERPAVRRDEAPADRDRPAQRRAGGHQRHRQRAGQAARLRGHHRTRRRAGAGHLRGGFAVHRPVRRRDQRDPLPVRHRRGRALRSAGSSSSDPGITSTVIRTGRPLRDLDARGAGGGGRAVRSVGPRPQSWLGVPIIAGERVIGVVGLESILEHAFSEADERLLSTLASSMGVALENARLFEETKRLLTETDQRAAELAIINSVQDGLAAELDMQAMYDLVGDKILGDLRHPGRRHRGLRPGAGLVPVPVHDRARRPVPGRADGAHRLPEAGPRDRPVDDDQRGPRSRAAELGQTGVIQGEAARSAIYAPLLSRRASQRRGLAPEPRSRARLQPVGPRPADDAGGQPERRPRQRPPDRRDPPAGRRAGHRQQRRPGAGRAAGPRCADRAARRPDARHVRCRPRLRRAPRSRSAT